MGNNVFYYHVIVGEKVKEGIKAHGNSVKHGLIAGGKLISYESIFVTPYLLGPRIFINSVRVHFAYGKIAVTLKLLGQFG